MRAAPKTGFVTAAGQSVSVGQLLEESGGLPVVLAFFKKTCPVCKLAWPYLQRLHAAYGGKAVRVVGVSQNDLASSRVFYAEYGPATFDLLLDPEPGFGASNAFDVDSVPHIVLLEPDGRMSRVFEGWDRKQDRKSVV